MMNDIQITPACYDNQELRSLYESAFNVYRTYDDIEMTIMMSGPGTFTLEDWDIIVSELRKFWTWD